MAHKAYEGTIRDYELPWPLYQLRDRSLVLTRLQQRVCCGACLRQDTPNGPVYVELRSSSRENAKAVLDAAEKELDSFAEEVAQAIAMRDLIAQLYPSPYLDEEDER